MLPALNAQKRIVAKVDELMTLFDALEDRLNKAQNKKGPHILRLISRDSHFLDSTFRELINRSFWGKAGYGGIGA